VDSSTDKDFRPLLRERYAAMKALLEPDEYRDYLEAEIAVITAARKIVPGVKAAYLKELAAIAKTL
jgi:hypothetical protein